MNSWNFTGNIGNSAEQRHTPSGDSVVQFSVATLLGNKRDHAPSSSNNANTPAQNPAPSANSQDAVGGFADMDSDILFAPIGRRLAMVI